MLIRYLFIISACLLLSACDSVAEPDIDYGEIKDGLYTNNYFKMSIQLPSDWSIQSQAEQKKLMKSGTELLSGDNQKLKSALKASQKQSVNMFSVFRYEQGAPVDFNPSIISVAEKVSHMPGVKKGADYLFHVKKVLNAGQLKYDFSGEIYSKELSGVSFDVMPSVISMAGMTIKQEYYAAIMNDYALGFILSYTTDADGKALNNIINTLEFKN